MVSEDHLFAYGSGILYLKLYRHLRAYRILTGEPANLPVQQSPKVEFVINLKTGKTLAMTFPLRLVSRAHEVIE